MTRTRARRLIRTAFVVWAFVCLAAGTMLSFSGHFAAGAVGIGCCIACIVGAWIADPVARPGRPAQPRQRQQPRQDIEVQVAEFAAQISAWEASQRAKP